MSEFLQAVVSGVVVRGEKRGMALGYPTANIALVGSALSGVYAARVEVVGEANTYTAAVFADPARGLLEAHLLDFEGDLYGREIAVALIEKIRDAKDFDDDIALSAAIADDVARTRALFPQ